MLALRLQVFVSEATKILMACNCVELPLRRLFLRAFLALGFIVNALARVCADFQVLLVHMLQVVFGWLGLARLCLDFAHHVIEFFSLLQIYFRLVKLLHLILVDFHFLLVL